MARDEQTAGEGVRSAAKARSHLFAVRLWKHEAPGATAYRGSVREVLSGAFRNFRDWSELAAFMTSTMEGDESTRPDGTEGEAQ
jgi:hypothetical protein